MMISSGQPRPPNRDLKHVFALALIGGTTGLLTYLEARGVATGETYATNITIRPFRDYPAEWHGAVFGLAVALYVVLVRRVAVLRLFFLIASFTFSWVVAMRTGVMLSSGPTTYPHHYYTEPLVWIRVGMVSGFVGAGIVALGVMAAFPQRVLLIPAAVVVGIGTVVGALFATMNWGIFFPVWQAAVGASFGLVVARIGRSRRLGRTQQEE